MKNLKYYLERAQKEGWAIGQFNFSDFNQIKAIVSVADKMKSPVILGTSEGESKFFGLTEAIVLRDSLRKETGLPIFLNLDHGKSFEYLKQAIDAGYDMVHFDGSKLPLEENIKITKQVKKYAGRQVLVEGELGIIATDASKIYHEQVEIREENLTVPKEAKEYAKKTGVDLLAVSIGNLHGMPDLGQEPRLRLDRLQEIKKEVGNLPMVLHGGSGTDQADVKKAIELGIVKININTELRLAFAKGLREALKNSEEIVPYKFLPQAQEAVEKVVGEKIKLFDSLNKI